MPKKRPLGLKITLFDLLWVLEASHWVLIIVSGTISASINLFEDPKAKNIVLLVRRRGRLF
jgi:hypothetical protein